MFSVCFAFRLADLPHIHHLSARSLELHSSNIIKINQTPAPDWLPSPKYLEVYEGYFCIIHFRIRIDDSGHKCCLLLGG